MTSPKPRTIAEQAQEAADLARVLHKAGEQFQFYAAEHRKKGTPGGDAKAETNTDWARRCFAACAAWEDSQDGE